MNVKRSSCHVVVWLAIVAMCAPAQFVAADELKPAGANSEQLPAARIRDVSLEPGGLLVGHVFDQSLQPIAGTAVALKTSGQTLATTTTDARGAFAVAGLRGGVHQISTDQSIEVCRLWAPGTAPPAAVAQLRIVPGQGDLVRGQQYCEPQPHFGHKAKAWATNPWVIGGVVAAAITGPILLHNLDDDDDSGS